MARVAARPDEASGPSGLLRHTGAYLIARGLPGLLAFAGIIVFSRLLDPAAYGTLTLLVSSAAIVNALAYQWLRLGVARFAPGSATDTSPLPAVLGLFVLVSGVVLGLTFAVWLMRGWFSVPGYVVPLVSIMSICQGAYELQQEWLRARLMPRQYGLSAIMRAFFTFFACILIFELTGSVAMMTGGYILGWLVPFTRQFRLHAAKRKQPVWQLPNLPKVRVITGYGLPLVVAGALTLIVASSDRFMLAALLGTDVAGKYAVGYDIADQSLGMLMAIVSLATFPHIVRTFDLAGAQSAVSTIQSSTTILLAVGLPVTALLATFSGPLARTMFAPDYRSLAVAVIPIISVSTLLSGVRIYHWYTAFQLNTASTPQVWIAVSAAVANLGLNAIFIPLYGAIGAAWATFLAYTAALVMASLLARQHFVAPFPWARTAQIALSATPIAVSGVIGSSLPQDWSLSGIACIGMIAVASTIYLTMLRRFQIWGPRRHGGLAGG